MLLLIWYYTLLIHQGIAAKGWCVHDEVHMKRVTRGDHHFFENLWSAIGESRMRYYLLDYEDLKAAWLRFLLMKHFVVYLDYSWSAHILT